MNEMNEMNDMLAANPRKQDALLGYLLIDEQFFLQAYEQIKFEWFQDPFAGKVYQAKLVFYKQYKRIPTVVEVEHSETLRLEDQGHRNRFKDKIIQAIRETKVFSLEPLTNELTEWLHARLFHKLIENGVREYKRNNFENAATIIRDGVKEIDSVSFGGELPEAWDDYKNFFEQSQLSYKTALTFGSSAVDGKLVDNYTPGTGGLLRGDMTILLAPTNIGKTTCLITIAKANVFKRKYVLLVTHEGRPEDIKLKTFCSFLGINRKQVFKFYDTPEGMRKIQLIVSLMKEYFTFVSLHGAEQTVGEAASAIRRLQEKQIARTGKGFDLFLDDYPAVLTTEGRKKGNSQFRHAQEEVYQYFSQLALEYNWHCIAPIQTNRTGSQINRGQKGYDKRLLSMEDVMESWGPMTKAANVISMNMSPADQVRNLITYHICKSRSNKTGWSIVCNSDLGKAITHSDKLGATWYHGTQPMALIVESLLSDGNGGTFEEFMTNHQGIAISEHLVD